jgi:hypothetical protein
MKVSAAAEAEAGVGEIGRSETFCEMHDDFSMKRSPQIAIV